VAPALQNLQPELDAVRCLALLSGRGKRSAIGLHGFVYGGLICDLGYEPTAAACTPVTSPPVTSPPVTSPPVTPRPVATRGVAFPQAWPVVLILRRRQAGSSPSASVHGQQEENLLLRVGAQPNPHRAAMLDLAEQCLAAAEQCAFSAFTTALERYMLLAADMFREVQHGMYRDAQIAACAHAAVDAGLRAVGQSSWGPTVFGLAASRPAAELAADALRGRLDDRLHEVRITSASAHGAQWRYISES
jgi:beta-ribofuranosylaminobenzene 5'-phosphate synthase